MSKINLLPIVTLSFFLFSLKSLAVPNPEYINWRAHPREFVISLSEAIFGTRSDNNAFIESAASQINNDPNSRLELFWMFLDAPKYRYSEWAKQEKEYHVYYKYVTSGNLVKYSYYVAKQSSGANLGIQGRYNFGEAMALRDFYATYVERSIEYGELRNFVPRSLRSSSISNANSSNSIPTGKCPLIGKATEANYSRVLETNDPNNQTQIVCHYGPRGRLMYEAIVYKIGGIKHGLYIEYALDYLENDTHYLSSYGYYNNGKANGVWKSYFPPYKFGGEVILGKRIEYSNGVELLTEYYYPLPGKVLRASAKYNNGKTIESTSFYENGQMKHKYIYDSNGTKVSEEEWYENGRKK